MFGVALVAGAGVALAGCSDGGGDADGAGTSTAAAPDGPADPAPVTAPAASEAADGTAGAGQAAVLAAVADVPVGGGIVLTDQNVVLTQPTEGDIKGFSATCTHAGCAVTTVADGVIRCPCHGSTFDITTGEPQGGPAARALPAVAVAVSGSDVVSG
jgi:Rieske Fe-S protein